MIVYNSVTVFCKDCCYFLPASGGSIQNGQCRRYPPKVNFEGGYDSFPIVSPVDWCGEFALQEVPNDCVQPM